MQSHDNSTSMLLDFSSLTVPSKILKNVCQTGWKPPLSTNSNGVIRLELWSYLPGATVLSIKSYDIMRLQHNYHEVIYDILQSNI